MVRSNSRKRIAYFSERYLVPGTYYGLQWAGACDQAKVHGIDLVSVIGGELGYNPQTRTNDVCRNRLYEYVSADNVDAVIVAGGILSFVTPAEIQEFIDRYAPVPLVSIAETLQSIPSILVENEAGIRELVEHLIRDHGYTRIAFVRGPGDFGDAQVRYKIYRELLEKHGIAYDENYVTVGDYLHASGTKAVATFLDERRIVPEAIVCANDNMAIGAMREIRRRNLRIPQDIAVVGYDGTDESKTAEPPLTTVYQPIYEQGKRAVDYAVSLLSGEDNPRTIVLPTRMILGQSCGCQLSSVIHAGWKLPPFEPTKDIVSQRFDALKKRRGEITLALSRTHRTPWEKAFISNGLVMVLLERLFDTFVIDLEQAVENPLHDRYNEVKAVDPLYGFLLVLSETLRHSWVKDVDTVAWQDMISTLRREVLATVHDAEVLLEAERLWGQARVVISETLSQFEIHRRFASSRENRTVFEIGGALSTTFDTEKMIGVLAERVAALKIPSCFLARYVDPVSDLYSCEMLLAYTDGRCIVLSPEQEKFDARSILPAALWPNRSVHFLVEALFFHDEPIGILILEVGPADGDVYEYLRAQISNAMKGSVLVKQVQERAWALEQANREIQTLNAQLKTDNVRMHTEMDLARQIQTALLPRDVKNIHPDFEIAARMLPAEEVGGDYYDVSLDQNGRLWLGIGDVSGHGVTPGLIMMMAQTIHTTISANQNARPHDMVRMINRVLYKNVYERLGSKHYMTFATMQYQGDGYFHHAGAHIDFLIFRHQTQRCEFVSTQGMWLNIMPEIGNVTLNSEFKLERGDILVLYTDGMTEAFDKDDRMLGSEGLAKIVARHARHDVETMRDSIVADVLVHCANVRKDDMTLVVAKRL